VSKKTKSARTEKRKKEKQQRRAAQKNLYRSYAEAGKSKKSGRYKRSTKKNAVLSSTKHRHLTTDCGNPGCMKCYPRKVK
jgi:hypothetical protein